MIDPEFNNSSPVSPETDLFIKEAAELFDAENVLPTPTMPVKGFKLDEIRPLSQYIDVQFMPKLPEATLDERISLKELGVRTCKLNERARARSDRKKRVFGEEYALVSSFNTVDDYNFDGPNFEVGLNNRNAFLRYLQQRGLVLVDDTGRSRDGKRTNKKKGTVFFPSAFDPTVYDALEDEIRSIWPFVSYEFDLQKLYAERDGQQHDSTKTTIDEKKMREKVDLLAMDNRFMKLFDWADKQQEVRRSMPRTPIGEVVSWSDSFGI